jgi:hypothetical protein
MSALLSAAALTLVFCAPGYPGASGDAQPYLDQFAHATASAAGWPGKSLDAVYDPSETGGLTRLAAPDAALAFVPFPFFVQHARELRLTALVEADVTDTGPQQRWALVAKRGRITGTSLSGLTIISTAGYASVFVRDYALKGWSLSNDVRIESTGQVLSALRRAAAGEPVAALLDQPQSAALASLPFANELQVVAHSPELPVAVVATVGSRLDAGRARALKAALLALSHDPANVETLASLRLKGFIPAELPGSTTAP